MAQLRSVTPTSDATNTMGANTARYDMFSMPLDLHLHARIMLDALETMAVVRSCSQSMPCAVRWCQSPGSHEAEADCAAAKQHDDDCCCCHDLGMHTNREQKRVEQHCASNAEHSCI